MDKNDKTTTRRRTIWINDATWARIAGAAETDGRTSSGFIRAAIIKALAENERV